MSLGVNKLKQNFFEENTKFVEVDPGKVGTVKGFHDIDEENEEVWFLQCPKGYDVQQLYNHKFKFPGRSKIKEYEATAMEATTPTKVSFGYGRKQSYNVKILPIAGNIVMREQMPAPVKITEEHMLELYPPTTVSMPECKLRHPLLGAKFDEYIKSTKSAISNGNAKRPIKSENSPSKRKRPASTVEVSSKKLKSEPNEKIEKSPSSTLDISEDLKWIKEL